MTDHIEYNLLPCQCEKKDCPVFKRCCFLPTECHPGVDGKISILFVGQGGGADERKLRRPFIGRAGKRIRQQVIYARKLFKKHFGVAFSNTIRDNPEDNRVPTQEELDVCLGHLYADIKTLKERGLKAVIPLGNAAKLALIPDALPNITKDRGKLYTVSNEVFGNVVMIPTFHPSYVMRNVPVFCKSEMDKVSGEMKPMEPSKMDMDVIGDIIQAAGLLEEGDGIVTEEYLLF